MEMRSCNCFQDKVPGVAARRTGIDVSDIRDFPNFLVGYAPKTWRFSKAAQEPATDDRDSREKHAFTT